MTLPVHIIISYHIVDLKQQHRLKVGTNKPKLKVKMQSVHLNQLHTSTK